MKQRFVSIQYLRIAAALLVIFHHARNPHPWLYNGLPDFNLSAVTIDVFFVISGFVMYASSKDETVGRFLHRRLVRVIPIYWLATLVTAPLVVMNHHEALDGRLLVHLVQSLFFIPHYSPEHPSQIWPILVVGWTLNYEMFFYMAFAVGLAMCRVVAVLAAAVIPMVAAGLLFHSSDPLWLTYTDPLMLEFLAGVGLAMLGRRLADRNLAPLLPLGIVGVILCSTVVHLPEVLGLGVCAVMITAGVLSIEQRGRLVQSRLCDFLGQASYGMYVGQVFCIGMMGLALQRLPLHGPLQFVVMVCGCLAASIGAGVVMYLYVERPLLKVLLGRSRNVPPTRAHTVVVSASATQPA